MASTSQPVTRSFITIASYQVTSLPVMRLNTAASAADEKAAAAASKADVLRVESQVATAEVLVARAIAPSTRSLNTNAVMTSTPVSSSPCGKTYLPMNSPPPRPTARCATSCSSAMQAPAP